MLILLFILQLTLKYCAHSHLCRSLGYVMFLIFVFDGFFFLFAFQVLFCLQIFSWASQQDQPFQLSLAEEGKWSNKVLINNVLKLSVKIILPFSTVIFVKEFLFLVKSTQKPVHSCLNYIFFQKMPSQIIRLLKIPFLTTLHYFLA